MTNAVPRESPASGLQPARATDWVSWVGLGMVVFFLAEVNGVTLPFVTTYLLENDWSYDAIGVAVSLTGLVSLLVHTPAGFLIDRARHYRAALAVASLVVGGCFLLLPLGPPSPAWVLGLLGLASVGRPLFGLLTNALTLGLTGPIGLNRAVGVLEGWNHAGNILAALTAILLVSWFATAAVFYAVAVASAFAAASLLLVRPADRAGTRALVVHAPGPSVPPVRFWEFVREPRVAIFLGASALFHLANAPVMPLVAQKVKHVGGSDAQVAGLVLAAQGVMIPVALAAGWAGDRWGRKAVLAVGFVVLPVRIILYGLTDEPGVLVALQTLDGVGAGIFGVTAVAVCADLANDRGHFNTLSGVLATAVGIGGVVGPLAAGLLVQHAGFTAAFAAFALVATAAAGLFIGLMPETAAAGEAGNEDGPSVPDHSGTEGVVVITSPRTAPATQDRPGVRAPDAETADQPRRVRISFPRK
ncbi:MFS transporter [Fimbriiglobus ruber]|uniref:Major facilitator superfamily n=1 Tax=Fimbriiglobus ruber TaxID=1908690 RepID=A0A225DKK7_9BACT|nr:MFS transporter [Fimbriiglobus ruber]OWK41942.1 Major facilitator superfamily [Fimbriiglobus ruber]